jgi:hypothetical protein
MAHDKLLLTLFIVLILFFPGCSQNSQETDKNPKNNISESSDTTLEDVERCTKDDTGESMSYGEAREIAENSVCAKDGMLKSTHWCNSVTGTWWIDTNIVKEGCSPTCVINVATKEAEINWMCTGAKQEATLDATTTRYRSTTFPQTTMGIREETTTTMLEETAEEPVKLAYAPDNPPAGSASLNVDSEGFAAQYAGYSFKIGHLFYVSEYTVGGSVIDVQKPDGTIVQVKLGYDECHKTYYDARVDDVVLRLQSANEADAVQSATVYAWNYKSVPVIKNTVPPIKPDPNAKLISDVTSEGFTAQYGEYKFKVDHLEYSSSYHAYIVVLDVEKPDGTIVELAVREGMSSRVDNLNVASPFCGTVEEAAAMQTAAIWVWEGSTTGTTIPQKEIYPLVYTPDKPPQGSTPIDVSGEGFTGQYNGYKFKIEYFEYIREYGISGMLLDVQNPDGTIVMRKLGYDECHKTYYDAQVGDIVLRLISAHEAAAVLEGRIYAWNYKTTPVIQKQVPYEKPNPNAKLLEGVSSEGFTKEYNGYKFKVDSLEYSREYHPSAILLDVEGPDGTIKQATVKEGSSTRVDGLNIASPFCGTVQEVRAVQSASLWVW